MAAPALPNATNETHERVDRTTGARSQGRERPDPDGCPDAT